jgi:hypothetical protein
VCVAVSADFRPPSISFVSRIASRCASWSAFTCSATLKRSSSARSFWYCSSSSDRLLRAWRISRSASPSFSAAESSSPSSSWLCAFEALEFARPRLGVGRAASRFWFRRESSMSSCRIRSCSFARAVD